MDDQSRTMSLPLKRAVFMLAAAWTIVIVLGASWHLQGERGDILAMARMQASNSFEKDQVYRRWAAGHGGVYVPVTEEMPPNPYLSHVENRDVTTTSGLNLTLVDPAYITRQVNELGRKQYGHQGHITSLNPLRPENVADAWETNALQAFERGETEVAQLAMIGDAEYLRLMRPMYTEARCLKCHAIQGYKVGDVRGGISVSVPMAPLWGMMHGEMAVVMIGCAVVWLLGLGGIGLGASRMRLRIRERERAEEELLSEKQRLEDVTNSVKCGLLLLDEQARVTYANTHAQEWLGSFDEIGGKRCCDVFNLEVPEKECAALEVLRTGKTAHGENFTRVVSGEERVFRVIASPVKNSQGKIRQITEVVFDITERIRSEEERVALQQQLQQAQKMEAVAQLAAGVAHDFNNLLTVISGCVSVARSTLPDDHKAVEPLRGVQEAAEQAAGVTRSLLTFSHKMEIEKEPVELRASVETSLRLLRRVLPAGIEVVADTAGEPVWVRANETQLQQVIMNLAINARDAMPGGGTLKIALSESTPETSDLASFDDPQALVARLVVGDSGTGMEPEVLEHIFEPFFTTKPRGQGTGLGLAITHSIVEDHHGRIRVESEAGKGTTFTIELPLLDVDALRGAPEDVTPPRRGRGEVILLAEDNRHVRGILTSALESLDYEVVHANDGSALVDCFERHSGRIELLILGIDLPKRGGLDCLREIRSSGSFVPAIVITGGVGAGLEKQLDSDTTLLRKPFQITDFTALAGDVLAARLQREEWT